jgi:hypothetical protein
VVARQGKEGESISRGEGSEQRDNAYDPGQPVEEESGEDVEDDIDPHDPKVALQIDGSVKGSNQREREEVDSPIGWRSCN